jgi:putative RNA 2'-phosphotransferase
MEQDRSPQWVQLSRFMALVLRHRPDEFGVELDSEGFAHIDDLLDAMRSRPQWARATRDDILEVIQQQDRPRFEIKDDYVRALYGHSLPQRIEYKEIDPPEYLYHGTTEASLGRIKVEGLLPMERQYVHLSGTPEDAREVGLRRTPQPVVLRIRAREANETGAHFFQADPHIYLTKKVARQFIEEMKESPDPSTSQDATTSDHG